jgi:hypothetical protein
MYALIGVLVSGIPAVIAAVLAYLTRKIATATGAIATFAVLTLAFVAAIHTALDTVSGMFTAPAWVSNAVGMFIPSNFGVCLGALVSARIARGAYDLARAKLALITGAS